MLQERSIFFTMTHAPAVGTDRRFKNLSRERDEQSVRVAVVLAERQPDDRRFLAGELREQKRTIAGVSRGSDELVDWNAVLHTAGGTSTMSNAVSGPTVPWLSDFLRMKRDRGHDLSRATGLRLPLPRCD
jgi:hypothetical protein